MSMTQVLLAPLFLHVILIVIIGAISLRARIAAVRRGQARLKEIATDSAGWPPEVRKLGNNFDNQFQTPMLWYAVCALIVTTGLADGVSAGLSWLFLATRIGHAAIHTGSNQVPRRLVAFVLGMTCLLLLWGWFGIRLYLTG
jgi:hypothetical protein